MLKKIDMNSSVKSRSKVRHFSQILLSVLTAVVVAESSSYAQDTEPAPSLLPKLVKFYEKKQFDEAQKLLVDANGKPRSEEEVLKSEKYLEDYILYYWGAIALGKSDYDLAQQKFNKALSLSPNTKLKKDLQVGIASIALALNKNKEALNLLRPLEKSMRREENYVDVLSMLARAERATGRIDLFCKRMITIYEKFPHHPAYQAWTANLSQNKFDDKSIPCSAKFEDRSQRIRTLQLSGLSDKAWTEIQALKEIESKNNYEIARLEAQYYIHEGELQKAMAVLLPLYEERKTDFNYLVMFGQVSARSGEVSTAVGSYYKAYKLNPGGKFGRQALYQAAFLSYQYQDYDGAAQKFTEFIKKYPRSGLSKDAKWQMAWIKYLKSDFTGAYKDMKQISSTMKKKSSTQDRVKYWMAMSLMKQGKMADARQYFEDLSKDPLNGFYSISAKVRLDEVNASMAATIAAIPKAPKQSLSRFQDFQPRFSVTEMLMPAVDQLAEVTEETESEETLAAEAPTEPTVAEESESETMISAEGTAVEVENAEEEKETKTSFSNPLLAQRFEKVRRLREVGVLEWAKWDLYEIERKTSNPDYLKALMAEYENLEVYNRASNIGHNNFMRQRSLHGIHGVRHLWESSYPKAYEEIVKKASRDFDVPQELIWGIMKAESSFKHDVVSPVGAMGLMQIMPYTGEKVAKLLKEDSFQANTLFEPKVAIRYGARYLQKLSNEFSGNLAFVAAGYNAGPHRVLSWINSIGRRDLDEFIEHIPFLETRNYVKKVLSYAQTYRVLYTETPKNLKELSKPVDLRLPATIPTKEQW